MMMPEAWSEDLLWQAQRALELGRTLCSCSGYYHALWGMLRATGVMGSLKSEETLLASLVLPFIRDHARVMIGGSADPGVLCAVGRVYGPRSPNITIIDRCAAPLQLVREFAAAKRLTCRTLNADLLELDGRETWDQIVLHYTPDFVEPGCRARFFSAIASALAQEGSLVCVTMTGPKVPDDRKAELTDALLTSSLRALRQSGLDAHLQERWFARMLEDYAEASAARRLALPTPDELSGLLENARLKLVRQHTTSREQHCFGRADASVIVVAVRD